MPKLVEDADMYKYLGIDPDIDDPNGIVPALRDTAENMLEAQTSQVFGPSEVLVQDPYDGYDGGKLIYVRRPMLSLQKIEFRYLPEITQELYFNLDITQYITWKVGGRRIYSHVYPFPRGRDNILISYTTQANTPALAVGAIKDVVAAIWRAIGSEDARTEQRGTFQHSLIRSLDESKVWTRAVELLQVPVLG